MTTEAASLRDVTGRDAPLPRWAASTAGDERPRFDSVVVCGNGVGASVMAARLARSEALAGRVVIAASPVSDDRRLVGGLTLRSRALDYYAAAFGTTRSALLERLFGDRAPDAATTHQLGSLFVPSRSSGAAVLAPAKLEQFMTSADHGGRTLAYGVRNSHLAARLLELARTLPLELHAQPVDSLEAARALAPGSRPLVVNATARPLHVGGQPGAAAGVRAWVAATQLPFAAPRLEERGLLGRGASLMACVPREARNDLGVFNPLVDPLSPAAAYYGIVFRVLRAQPPPEKDREQARLREELLQIADCVGLEPVDADETEGRALVPCTSWKDLRSLDGDVLELNRLYHAGTPIITGDGMTRAGLSGLACAEAVIAGEDPVVAANTVLRKWRRANAALAAGMTSLSRIAALGIRLSPRRAIGGGADLPDFWAGIDGVA